MYIYSYIHQYIKQPKCKTKKMIKATNDYPNSKLTQDYYL